MTKTRSAKLSLAVAMCAFAVIALAATAGMGLMATASPGSHLPPRPVIPVHVDHMVYDNETAMRADADAVVTGRVMGPGVLSRVQPVPLTDFRVTVDTSYKGSLTGTITIAMTGGETDGATIVVDGVPKLQAGQRFLFYLHRGTDGRFYPLAGSTAVGVEVARDSFRFAREVSGPAPGISLDARNLRQER
jgi:hypothetical protein